MSSTFEILMNQINMPLDMRQSSAFLHAEIEQVLVHKVSHIWEFHFSFEEILPIDIFQELKKCLKEEFSKTGNQAVFEIRTINKDFTDELLQAYYQEAFTEGPCTSQGFQSIYHRLKVHAEENQLVIEGPSSIDTDHFRKIHLPNLAKQLVKFGFPQFQCQVKASDALTQQQVETFQAEKEKIVQAANDEALKAIEALQKMAAPPVEEKTSYSGFQAKKAIARPKLDKAEITQMNAIQTEENRIVFEGMVFDLEKKVTRTGRVLINFKMTDYTSSFALQKWFKNEEEAKKYDMIKKNSWLRVRGNIEMNNFTHDLTMNVQDVQEVVHYDRKDLMPEGEKRIEFHAHTNMSTMDALPEVEDLIATAAKWGHKAVAITDHGNVQSFPHGYKAAKKAGIQLIYGMEANIVEDRVPITYNEIDMELGEATYVVFDVETTGLSAIYNDLIQVAASKMYKGNVIAEFDEFINPGHPLSAFTTDLTGITDEHVKNAKPLEQVLQEFQEFCKDTVLVAHNATFDVGFMNVNYERHGLPKITQPVIDTLEFARNLYPEYKRHGLGPLTKRFQVSLDHHHMANYDAEATGRLLFIFIRDVAEKRGITNLNKLNTDLVDENSYKKARVKYATIYVKNQTGLKNIFKLVSLSNTKYFEGVPRIPRTVLDAHREGLVLGTACSEGEVFDAVVSQGLDAAVEVAKYYDFIEIMPPAIYAPLIAKEQVKDMEELHTIIKNLIEVGKRLDKPVLATGDVHYIEPEEEIYREIIVRSLGQGAVINRTIGHGENAQPAPLPKAHFRTTNEMLDEFAFLGDELARQVVIENPNQLALTFEPIEVVKGDLYTPFIDKSEEKVAELTYAKAFEIYGNPLPDIVDHRIERELSSILGNGFAVIYLASQMLVQRSNKRGYLVGSRGSVGSSFVATMIGITEVNPLSPHYVCGKCQYSEFITDGSYGSGFDMPDKDCPKCGHKLSKNGQDIPFETFLGFDGDKVPDIDLNFSGEDQPSAHLDVRDIFGEEYAFRAGTVGTVAAKTAYGFVKGYERDYNKFYRDAEVERLAQGASGVKRTTGQHPGGIVVIPNYMDVYDFTPVQYPADDLTAEWQTTHFNFHDIDENVLKLDVLGHDDPTMIRKLQDLSGIDPNDIPMDDKEVMALFSGTDVLGVTQEQIGTATGMLGIPEFGTNFVRGMVDETHPTTFAELLQLSGLSHGTDVWLGNAQDLIKQGIADLSTVIGCRDDIMVYLMHKGLEPKMAFTIMERVRKGAWLKISDEERNGYIAAMKENNVPEWYIESCGKIKYMFPKAHAAAYVMMALRVAYFKVHHPIYYYCAYFSIRAKAFDIKVMSSGLDSVKRKMNEISEKRKNNEASNVEIDLYTTLEIVNEMLERGFKFGKLDLYKSDATEFLIDGDMLIPPFSAMDGLGDNVANQLVKARAEGEFLSKTELRKRGGLSATLVEKMDDMGILGNMPEDNQLSLFDDLF
ncbi:PolC-type DNA polymerase III [Streptococcus constellatus subsp. pharyngis]|uniref:DNA polymerase III PolC-type n=2 Tax=Bacillati TaxID=1783272 RepID=F9P7R3_STRCV|nr:PolC-type DNA polymerase III [Streptococcus constellatus]AGU73418.1 DNA polymerase III subunit alpha, Gram-positive type [Streptococcus constellatus subsp. pharyngis C232]AGU75172.1 DNA polymerase III subunit alpha, Gram-positive type [Streptococcus constellatus subsp. pharyngis C818]AGU80563.1 DNA polymerase III subunit alpha, Gram-positive type [Streptococcus constellatus subsp. pharyngis C1050]EGV08048.1 DNA polymerase III, alpha subunit, Gram-positive type [Streptococcus constellatus sub